MEAARAAHLGLGVLLGPLELLPEPVRRSYTRPATGPQPPMLPLPLPWPLERPCVHRKGGRQPRRRVEALRGTNEQPARQREQGGRMRALVRVRAILRARVVGW